MRHRKWNIIFYEFLSKCNGLTQSDHIAYEISDSLCSRYKWPEQKKKKENKTHRDNKIRRERADLFAHTHETESNVMFIIISMIYIVKHQKWNGSKIHQICKIPEIHLQRKERMCSQIYQQSYLKTWKIKCNTTLLTMSIVWNECWILIMTKM